MKFDFVNNSISKHSFHIDQCNRTFSLLKYLCKNLIIHTKPWEITSQKFWSNQSHSNEFVANFFFQTFISSSNFIFANEKYFKFKSYLIRTIELQKKKTKNQSERVDLTQSKRNQSKTNRIEYYFDNQNLKEYQ